MTINPIFIPATINGTGNKYLNNGTKTPEYRSEIDTSRSSGVRNQCVYDTDSTVADVPAIAKFLEQGKSRLTKHIAKRRKSKGEG